MTKGQIIRACRARKNMTELQCAVRAGVPVGVWNGVENDEQEPADSLKAYVDKFTDGEVAIESWAS